ncbi:hypothetical protein LIA77_05921 [Sarocladium implicatum]|nr:hypothetical protein LIA77_05921 [Sarocladium implicatum]
MRSSVPKLTSSLLATAAAGCWSQLAALIQLRPVHDGRHNCSECNDIAGNCSAEFRLLRLTPSRPAGGPLRHSDSSSSHPGYRAPRDLNAPEREQRVLVGPPSGAAGGLWSRKSRRRTGRAGILALPTIAFSRSASTCKHLNQQRERIYFETEKEDGYSFAATAEP